MELNYKCGCGASHEVRLYDECRYCAKPISKIDWIMENLTTDELRSIIVNGNTLLKQRMGAEDGQTQTEAETVSVVGLEKRKGTNPRK